MARVTKTVNDAKEAREAIDAAKTLGMNLIEASFNGTFLTQKEELPCWPKTSEIIEIGYKFFTVEMDGEIQKIKPESDATVTLKFR